MFLAFKCYLKIGIFPASHHRPNKGSLINGCLDTPKCHHLHHHSCSCPENGERHVQAGCCSADTRCALSALACPPLPVGPAGATGSPVWLWPPTDIGQHKDHCSNDNNLNGFKGAVCYFYSPVLSGYVLRVAFYRKGVELNFLTRKLEISQSRVKLF